MTRRRGRPAKHYVTTWGEVVPGLSLRKSGRFYPVGRADLSFGSDEKLAVHRFRRWQSDQGIAVESFDAFAANSSVGSLIDAERERIRSLILENPKQAAIELNIPHLAFHPATPEKPSVTLAELPSLYVTQKRSKRGGKLDPDYQKNLKTWWTEFLTVCGSPTYARDVTAKMIQDYEAEIMRRFDGGMSPTYVRCRFAAVKAVLQFAIDFTKDKAECRRLLDECGIFKAPADDAESRPLTPAEFQALLSKADVSMRAMLLFGLNCGMHNGEVAKTLRSDVDLDARTLSARRSKNRNPRVAKLWGRTVEAIRAYLAERPNQSEYLFVSRTGARMTGERIRQRIVTLRESLGLPEDLTFEGVRDSALTAADGLDIEERFVRYFCGHKTGEKDKYVLRQANNPSIVTISEAIEREYLSEATEPTQKPKRAKKGA